MAYTVHELIDQVEIATGRKVVVRHWPSLGWTAGFHDFDYGDPMGYGTTQQAAVTDLMVMVEAVS